MKKLHKKGIAIQTVMIWIFILLGLIFALFLIKTFGDNGFKVVEVLGNGF